MRRNGWQRGEGKVGCLIGMVVLAIGLFIAFKMIPLKVKAAEVRQVLQDEAKSAGMHNDDQIRNAILRKAQDDQLQITAENIKIERTTSDISIELNYVIPVEFPGFTYQWHIENSQHNPVF